MIHIVIGFSLIGFGVWGVVDEWYYLMDFIKGASPIVMIIFGLFAIWLAVSEVNDTNKENENERS